MAVVEVSTKERRALFCCDECGSKPQPLRDNDALRNPFIVCKEHNQATGHHALIVMEDDAAYLTVRAGLWVEVYDYVPPWQR